MTGQELYALHCKASLEQGCLVDSWEEMEDHYRWVWERFAQLLEAAERCQF
jgi:hypothetical protein